MQGLISENVKIGTVMVSLGFLFLALGVMLFFDSGLLAIGNILLLAGLPFIIGLRRTIVFFNPFERRRRLRGILCFLGGFCLVLFRWGLLGMLIEVTGMIEIFGPFLPIVIS
jgi:hypothetical protein